MINIETTETTSVEAQINQMIQDFHAIYLQKCDEKGIADAKNTYIFLVNTNATKFPTENIDEFLEKAFDHYYIHIENYSQKTLKKLKHIPIHLRKEIRLVQNPETGLMDIGCNKCNMLLPTKSKNNCGICKCAWYCNSDCQTQDWNSHKIYCKSIEKKKISLTLPCSCVRSILKKCSFCNASVDRHLSCSFCRKDVYCNRDCQVKHYKIHKKKCRNYLICETCDSLYENTKKIPARLITCNDCSKLFCNEECKSIHRCIGASALK